MRPTTKATSTTRRGGWCRSFASCSDASTATASNAIAQRWIKARLWYSKDNDGLVHPWRGAVFLNPPFSRGLIARFAAHFIAEHKAGRLKRGILLCNASTDTQWWHALAERYPVCLTRGRFQFERANGKVADNNNSRQAIFGAGITVDELRRALEPKIGIVLSRARGR